MAFSWNLMVIYLSIPLLSFSNKKDMEKGRGIENQINNRSLQRTIRFRRWSFFSFHRSFCQHSHSLRINACDESFVARERKVAEEKMGDGSGSPCSSSFLSLPCLLATDSSYAFKKRIVMLPEPLATFPLGCDWWPVNGSGARFFSFIVSSGCLWFVLCLLLT